MIQWLSGQAPLEATFYAAVKFFDANITISGNFVSNVKNSSTLLHKKFSIYIVWTVKFFLTYFYMLSWHLNPLLYWYGPEFKSKKTGIVCNNYSTTL